MNEHGYIATNINELYHYGVKGMKWGVRKSDGGYSSANHHKKKVQLPKTTDKGNQKARAALMRNSVISGLKIATPFLAMGVAAIAGPAAAPAIMAGKEAVARALDVAGVVNLMYGSNAALVTDVIENLRKV